MCGQGMVTWGCFYWELESQRNGCSFIFHWVTLAAVLRTDCRSKGGSRELAGSSYNNSGEKGWCLRQG